MNYKYIFFNVIIGILGIIIVCIAGAYVVWLTDYIETIKIKESFVNYLIIIISYIIPTLILACIGFMMFIKVLYDPFDNLNH